MDRRPRNKRPRGKRCSPKMHSGKARYKTDWCPSAGTLAHLLYSANSAS